MKKIFYLLVIVVLASCAIREEVTPGFVSRRPAVMRNYTVTRVIDSCSFIVVNDNVVPPSIAIVSSKEPLGVVEGQPFRGIYVTIGSHSFNVNGEWATVPIVIPKIDYMELRFRERQMANAVKHL